MDHGLLSVPPPEEDLPDMRIAGTLYSEEERMNADRDKPATKGDLDQVEQKFTGKIDKVKQDLIAKPDEESETLERLLRLVAENGKRIDAMPTSVVSTLYRRKRCSCLSFRRSMRLRNLRFLPSVEMTTQS